LPAALAGKNVATLTALDLRPWRDKLAKSLAAATVNRTATVLKAALNHVADQDVRISNRREWEIGLATILGAEESRNVVLADDVVRRLIAEAYKDTDALGLLIEVAAVTGARYSQIARLEVQDLQGGSAPRLMMPASAKGKGAKKMLRRPVPIGAALASRLAVGATGRMENAEVDPGFRTIG
jgi:integrase